MHGHTRTSSPEVLAALAVVQAARQASEAQVDHQRGLVPAVRAERHRVWEVQEVQVVHLSPADVRGSATQQEGLSDT